MKKTIITLGMFLLSTISFAQIQNSLLNVTLGKTSRNKIQEMYPDAKGNWIGNLDTACYPGSELNGAVDEGEPAINIKNKKYAGIEWSFINFSFYLGDLCEISFSSEYCTANLNKSNWVELCNALSEKYKKYKETVHNANGQDDISYVIYSDGSTRIVTCCYETFYVLNYQDIKLFKKKYQSKLDSSDL